MFANVVPDGRRGWRYCSRARMECLVDDELEVVWPRDRSHYLTLDFVRAEDEMPKPVMAVTGRRVAARALVEGSGCTLERAAALVAVSRRTLSRLLERDDHEAVPDAEVRAHADALIAASARRGATQDERAAAVQWMTRVEPADADGSPRPRPRRARSPKASTNGRRRRPRGSRAAAVAVAALARQQQALVHRLTLLDYVMKSEQRNGGRFALGEAVTALVSDISDAARTIGTLLRPARRWRLPDSPGRCLLGLVTWRCPEPSHAL